MTLLIGATLLLFAAKSAVADEPHSATCWQVLAAADQDGDGIVTVKEAVETLAGAFGLVDLDGDGVLSEREHQKCMLDAGNLADPSAVTPRRTQKRFAEIDVDRDGSVSLAEYMTAGEAAYAEAAEGTAFARLASYAATTGEQGSGIADINGDELVSPMEAALDVLRTFAVMDVDGDRQIGRLEWATITERPKFTRIFEAIDRNRDKRVTRVEFLAAGVSDGPVSVWRHARQSLMPEVAMAEAQPGGVLAGASRSK